MPGGCLCCCGDKTTVQPFDNSEEFGPAARRKCRDVFFLLLFMAFWVGMWVVAALAISEGDINRLNHGVDMDGNMCGEITRGFNSPVVVDASSSSLSSSAAAVQVFSEDVDMRSLPVLYWPTPLDTSIQLCVAACPTALPTVQDLIDMLLPGDAGDSARAKLICDYDVVNATVLDVLAGKCWPPYPSTPLLGRCVPDVTNFTMMVTVFEHFFDDIANATGTPSPFLSSSSSSPVAAASSASEGGPTISVSDALKLLVQAVNAKETFSQALAEVTAAWKEILALCAASVVVAFLFVLVLRLFAGAIVWIVILLCLAALVGLTAFAWWLSDTLKESLPSDPALQNPEDLTRIRVADGFTYAMLVVDAIFLVLVVALRARIALAIGIVKEAGRCVSSMPSLVLFPAVICIMQLVFQAFWVVISLLLATASLTPKHTASFQGYSVDYSLRWLSLYWLFGFFWTSELISAIGQTTIAMAVSTFYWTREKKSIPALVPFRAFFTVLRYHLGSLALGALIIAVIRFMQAMLRYVEKKLKGKMDNRIVRVIMCLLRFWFWLLEKILKFINKNAYIMIAVKGQGFCASAKRAFVLILENILRVGVVNSISAFLLFLMRLFVAATCALVAAIILERAGLKFWFVPVVIVFIVAIVVASSFTSVYSMAIDTTLLSFCEDCSRNDGSEERPYFMSKELRKFVDGHKKLKKKEEDKKKKKPAEEEEASK